MRLAERVKSWLRKLGPSDEVEEIPVNIQESRGTGEDVAAVSQAQPSVAVGAPSDTLQKEPSPRPPLSAQQPDSDIPAATVSQTQPQPQVRWSELGAAQYHSSKLQMDSCAFHSGKRPGMSCVFGALQSRCFLPFYQISVLPHCLL